MSVLDSTDPAAVPVPPGSPFHAGEIALQARAGVRDRIEQQGRRAVRDHMPDQHRSFFAQLPFLVVGSLDGRGRPWASLLTGRPGFARSPDPRTLSIGAQPLPGDPLAANLREGAPLGLLGIELETRRRNRMNGTVTALGTGGFDVAVGQSFGNCPQYIQVRRHRFVDQGTTPAPAASEGPLLSDGAAALVRAADTFFIATAAPGAMGGQAAGGVDVSHRGGKPGFVRVTVEDGATVLTSPDFLGNFHFNTFGNIAVNPVAGLVFPDFATGDLLTLTGTAEVVWDGPELAAFIGAERLLRFRVAEGVFLPAALPLRWDAPDLSPFLDGTGSWEAVEAALSAAADRNTLRPLRVARVVDESATIRSLYLEPADGGPVPPHAAGQFLPLEIDISGGKPLRRTYTLSHAANGKWYRVSVKCDGAASSWLHDHARVGTVLRALAPRGDFTLDHGTARPVLLLSAGVGITPMLAMLEELLGPTGRTRLPQRRVHFIHAARDGREHAFGETLRRLAGLHRTLSLHVRFSAPGPDDALGRTHDSVGRIDADLLRSLLPLDDYEAYLCGPPAFMQAMYDALRSLGVRDGRIHAEAFGPAALARQADAGAVIAPPEPPAATEAVPVTFTRSGKAASWTPGAGSLLDLAEASGVVAPYGCRSGTCGTCAARLTRGQARHDPGATATRVPGEALLCSAVPALGGPLEIDL